MCRDIFKINNWEAYKYIGSRAGPDGDLNMIKERYYDLEPVYKTNCVCGARLKYNHYVYNKKIGNVVVLSEGCCKKLVRAGFADIHEGRLFVKNSLRRTHLMDERITRRCIYYFKIPYSERELVKAWRCQWLPLRGAPYGADPEPRLWSTTNGDIAHELQKYYKVARIEMM